MNASIQTRYKLLSTITEFIDLSPENPDHYIVEMDAPQIAADCRPGQFIHALPPKVELMLRRPFSLLTTDKNKGSISILFRVMGEGTQAMADLQPGDKLDIIGPLGNGFPMDLTKPALIAGGGVGIPPLVYLAEKFIEAGYSPDNCFVFLGARNPETMLCVADFRSMGIEPYLASEDGSMGTKGFITHSLNEHRDKIPSGAVVYSCGPVPMLDAIAGWSGKNNLECYVSMENKLGCGIGACLGCSIPVRHDDTIRYDRVCCDGPAFNSKDVAFDLIAKHHY